MRRETLYEIAFWLVPVAAFFLLPGYRVLGSQILIVSVGMATNRYLYPRLAYDPVADFVPVSLLALVPTPEEA